MPDIVVQLPSRGTSVSFPEDSTPDEIKSAMDKYYPRSGEDVAYDLALDRNAHRTLSDEDFLLYKDFLDKKKTDIWETVASAAGGLGQTLSGGIKGLFEARNLLPQVAAGTAVEGFAQGTRQLYGMAAQSQDPNSIMFQFKDWINGTGTVASQKLQWQKAREFANNSQDIEEGKDTAFVPAEFVNPHVASALSLVADPTLLIPGVGEFLGASRLASKVVGAGVKGAAEGVRFATRPLVGAIDAATEAAMKAGGANAAALKAAAASTGVTGVALGVPGVREGLGIIGGVKAADKIAEIASRAGERLAEGGSRIGPMESLGLVPDAGKIDRALAKVGRFGGDTAIDIGLAGATGAVEGAAIGAGLGYLSGGEEGAAAGLGSGAVLGGVAGAGMRTVGTLTGAVAKENRAADFNRFLERTDANTRKQFEGVAKRDGLDSAVNVMDMVDFIQNRLGDAKVTLLDTAEMKARGYEDVRGFQRITGGMPEIVINTDKFKTNYTMAHELFHALDSIEQFQPIAERIKQEIVGTYMPAPDGTIVQVSRGMLSPAEIEARFQEYKGKAPVADPNSIWNTATTLAEKARAVSNELGSEYLARLVTGSSPDAMLRGFDGPARTLLDMALARDASSRLRKIAESVGIGAKPVESLVFNGILKDGTAIPEGRLQQASPVLNGLLRDLVRARRNLSERMELANSKGVVITAKDVSNPIVADKAVKMGIAAPDANGVIKMKPDDVLAKEEKAAGNELATILKNSPVADTSRPHIREVDGELSGGNLSVEQANAIAASPTLPNMLKQYLLSFSNLLSSGENPGRPNVVNIQYGAATRRVLNRLTGSYTSKYSSGIRISDRDVAPYGLLFSKAGNPYVRILDVSKLRINAQDMASRGKLGAYGSDINRFFSDVAMYFENISNPSGVHTVDLPGMTPEKATFLNQTFGANEKGGSKYVRNIRLDRIIEMNPTGERMVPSELAWQRQKINWMPDEKLPNGTATSSEDGFRIIAKDGKHSVFAPSGDRVGIYDSRIAAERAATDLVTPKVGTVSIVDGNVIAPGSGSFKLTADVAKHFMPADDKVRLEDYVDRKVIALAADRMGIGPANIGPLNNRKLLSVPTQGGRRFMQIFKEGGWAFTDTPTANRFLKRVRQDADKNGNVVVAITVLNPINHLNNQTGQLAYVETMRAAIESGVISKSQADAHIKEISDRVVASKASKKSLPDDTRELFRNITDFSSLENAVKDRALNFKSAAWLVSKAKQKTLPVSYDELAAHGISVEQIASGLADKELASIPDFSVVALMEVNVNQKPNLDNFHYAYPVSVSGRAIGMLDKFYNLQDLTTNKKIRNKYGRITAQPVQTVMPILNTIEKAIKTQQGIPSDLTKREVAFMPSSIEPRTIEQIAKEVGGGEISGGAKRFGAFMRAMRDKEITVRDAIKSYIITLSSIQRGEQRVETVRKNWADAPFENGTKVRPEDAFARLLGTPEGQRWLDAAEKGAFDQEAANTMVSKFTTFGLQNKLLEAMKHASEEFAPKAQEIIDAVKSMPTDEFADYVRKNFPGISYGKVGFMAGMMGRGDLPTFDSRQKKLVYGRDIDVTKQRLLEQRDRLLQLGIKVANEYKDFAQTLLHHEVWDRLNSSDTEHGEIKQAMLNYMPETSGETGMYSQLEKTLEAIPEKASRQQIEAALRDGVKAKGQLIERPVKAEEMADLKDVTGLSFSDWLKQNPEATKSQMLDFARENRVRINTQEESGETKWKIRQDGNLQDETFSSRESAEEYIQDSINWLRGEFDIKNDKLTDPNGEEMYYIKIIDDENAPFAVFDSADVEQNRYRTRNAAVGFLEDEVDAYIKNEFSRYDISEEGGARYGDYTLPGGEKYKVQILTLPEGEGASGKIWFNDENSVDHFLTDISAGGLEGADYGRVGNSNVVEFNNLSTNQLQAFKDNAQSYWGKVTVETEGTKTSYKSDHFPEVSGYLAHVRSKEHRTSDGKKVLLGEEIQSDLHQKGRERGYAASEEVVKNLAREANQLRKEMAAVDDRLDSLYKLDRSNRDSNARAEMIEKTANGIRETQREAEELAAKIDEAEDRLDRALSNVPDAPFKKSWQELAFKYLLKEAVDAKADFLAWTTGKQQAERYRLSRQVDSISYKKNEDGTYALGLKPVGSSESSAAISDINGRSLSAVPEGDLPSIVGKEVANKIASGEGQEKLVLWNGYEKVKQLSGVDLNVGGEGMKGFYDRIIPQFADKYLKRYGVKTETIALKKEGLANLDKTQVEVHAVRITPEMRDVIKKEGQAMYMPDVPSQKISSAKTSLKQIPALFKKGVFVPNGRNIDIGAGAYDLGKRYLEDVRGVTESVPFDPFNRDIETNRAAVDRLKSGERFGTATIPNVLNVIAEPGVRDNVILQAARSIKPDGTAYFQIYTGDETGNGRITDKGWQNNLKTSAYVDEVKQHFRDVRRKDNFIIAKDPIITRQKASWFLGEQGPVVKFMPESMPNGTVYRSELGFSIVNKKGGNFRIYSPLGMIIGVAKSMEEAQRIVANRK